MRSQSTSRIRRSDRARTSPVPGLARAVMVGDDVFLRKPAVRDRNEFVDLRQANTDFLRPWEPIMAKGGKDFGSQSFDRMMRASRSPRYCKLLVCLKSTGEVIGSVNLNGISPAPFLSTTMGYWIGKDWSGRGFMTEGVNLMVCYAFTKLKLHRVEANIMPVNKASLRLIRRCGFRFEGLAKRYLQINGTWSDHERWGMTIEDWRSLRKRNIKR